MGIKSEYIDVMGPVFCHTLRPLLVRKNLWSLELEEVLSLWSLKNNPIDISKVWLCLFKVICQTMIKSMSSG